MTSLGFIVLRHVNSSVTDKYWRESLRCIRRFYPDNRIVVIDDNSSYEVIESEDYDYEVVRSAGELIGSAELLPYLLLNEHKWFDKAVILQDSAFLNAYLSFRHVHNVEFFWRFEHRWGNSRLESELLACLNESDMLMDHYTDAKRWNGAFGAMACVELSAVEAICQRFDLERLVPLVKSRPARMAFERVIAVLFDVAFGGGKASRFGFLHAYCRYGRVRWDNFEAYLHLPVIKIWTFR